MKKLLLSVLTIGFVGVVAVGATLAYFSDTETSNGNTFAAGSLDLNVDGGNANVVKFNVTNMRPGNQPKGTYSLSNVGSLNGYLDIENIVLTERENVCLDPELDAGDATCGNPGVGKGELGQVVDLTLFVDYGCTGWYAAGDKTVFSGMFSTLPGNLELDEPLNAGSTLCITAIANWWSTPSDNLAQSDDMTLDMTFELGQTTGQ